LEMSRWLTWQPGEKTLRKSLAPEPSKITKANSDGFDGSLLGHSSKISHLSASGPQSPRWWEPGNETNEKNEISPLDGLQPVIETSPEMEPTKSSKALGPPEDSMVGKAIESLPSPAVAGVDDRATPGELPPLVGRKNARGQMVLNLEDFPELENRLRLQGWKVRRHGDELICTSRGGLKIQ
jgi:hypothetical protein